MTANVTSEKGDRMTTLRLSLLLAVILEFCAPLAVGGEPCFSPLSKCPLRGCAKANTPNAFSNILKHNRKPQGDLKTLTFADFRNLQEKVEQLFDHEYATLSKPDRVRLRKLELGGETVGEGSLVEVVGFIAVLPDGTKPHANRSGESVNCRLTGSDNNDFHISLTSQRDQSEFEGIVVEMVPQGRDENWTEARLKQVQKDKLQVRVRGQLFFDNHHRVNDDENNNISNQPKRMSLWEIHPVTEFAVCTKTNCIADDPAWTPLEDWQAGGHQ